MKTVTDTNSKQNIEPAVSIVLPCLNEEATVGICIDEASAFLREHRFPGKVIVVDNGSTDRSVEIAREHGAAILRESRRGYGRAIRTGLEYVLSEQDASRGPSSSQRDAEESISPPHIIVFGDSDTTYDFRHMEGIVLPLLRGSYDVMIGDRFAGQMEVGAMPRLHRIGVPVLSALGRAKFHVDVRDFHCGLRGLSTEALRKMQFHTRGMEFATEFIAEAARKNLRIGQASVTLRRCTADRRPKLRTFRDGMRHAVFILRAHK